MGPWLTRTWRSLTRPRLRAKLVPLSVLATAGVLAATAWAALDTFRGELLTLVTEAGSSESDVLRVVLEEQMMAADRTLIRRLVNNLRHEPDVAWVALVDAEGRVRVSSDAARTGEVLDRSSAECQVCHVLPGLLRSQSVTLARPGGAVLRTVTPLVNRPPCQRCHDPQNRLNGLLIIDRSLDRVQRAVASGRDRVLTGTALAMLVLLVGIGLAVERIVITRLWRLRVAARDLGRGDLTARTADASGDELGELARDFNTMAERLSAAMAGLGAERQRLHELINGIDDGIVLVDTDLRVVTSNRAMAARMPNGAAPEPGASWTDLVREAGFVPPEGCVAAARALLSGRLDKQIIRIATPQERFEEVYAQPLHEVNGQAVGAIEVWRDITDRKGLEAGLEQSERLAAIGMLASGIAHEVGNPLASITTAVEGLLRRLGDPGGVPLDELREYLEIVNRQVFRCHEVTERLLGFARLPSDQLGVVDVASAAREVVTLVTPQARAQGVKVEYALAAPVPVLADDLLIRQVLLNLVVNALHAMPSGGVLRLEARLEAEADCLVVTDTGPGIPAGVLEHLFEPLRRAGTEVFGTGLGLFLSHTLVQRCGGSIAAASVAGGTTFIVRLRRPTAPGPKGGHDESAHRG